MKHRGDCFIGLDIGGTKTAGGIVDVRSGKLLHRMDMPTERGNRGRDNLDVVAQLLEELRNVTRSNNIEVSGTGIGICEIVDADGKLCSGSLLDWRGIDLASSLKLADQPHLVSDVRAAALAECRSGNARSAAHILYVSIGTGIASALVVGGVPYMGAHGAALVMATAPRRIICSQCGSETRMRLEDIASGPALARRFSIHGGDARPVLQAAMQGDDTARAIIHHAVLHLGDAIGQLANCLDPEVIVIGGGLGSAPGPYWTELRSAINESLWSGMEREISITQASLGADAGLIGAALAAHEGLH